MKKLINKKPNKRLVFGRYAPSDLRRDAAPAAQAKRKGVGISHGKNYAVSSCTEYLHKNVIYRNNSWQTSL